MRLAILCGTATLALATLAQAQDAPSWRSPDCATVEAGSLEAALMECSQTTAPLQGEVAEDSLLDLPPPAGSVETVAAEPDAVTREAHGPARGELREAEPTIVREESLASDFLPSPEAQPDEPRDMVADLGPESHELLQSIARAAEILQFEDQELSRRMDERDRREHREKDRGRKEGKQAGLKIPKGHRPPPGSCRIWHLDRPPGHQPPPTSCNVKVPRGAVLVR